MKVVILAGGLGKRLRPLTFAIPKPLIPIGEKPILEILISRLKKFGLVDIILAVGYKSELIKTYFGNGSKFGVNISYVEEPRSLGTAGPLKLVDLNEDFLVMNGDILTDLDFSKLIEFHKTNNNDLTVGIREEEHKTRFGVLDLEGDDIKGIREKPIFNFNISAGIYIVNPKLLYLIPNKKYDFPNLMLDSISKNYKVKGYKIEEDWIGVEHMDQFNEAYNSRNKWV